MKKVYVFIIVLLMVNSALGQWFLSNNGITNNRILQSVHFETAEIGYTVAGDGYGSSGIFKTSDGGQTWINQIYPHARYSVFFTSADTGFAIGTSLNYQGGLLRTYDGGLSWQDCNIGLLADRSLFFVDPGNGFAAGSEIYKTNDSGLNWSILPFPNIEYDYISSICFLDLSKGFVTTYDESSSGFILITEDGGLTWTIKDTCASFQSLASIFFADNKIGYAVGGDLGCLHRTTDGGETWDETLLFPYLYFEEVFFTDVSTGYIVGGNGLILKTIDGGDNWFEQNSGTTAHLRSVYFPTPDTGFIVGDSSVVLKTTNGGGYPVGVNEQNRTTPTLSLYPNPVSKSLTVTTPVSGLLSIHSTSGQQLLQKTLTEPNTTIDVSVLKSGVYVVKVVGEKLVQVGKFIKQ